MHNDMIDTIGFVEKQDPELAKMMKKELSRQRGNIELIASENFVSPAVMAAMGSVLTNKYAEGYPAHRYYGGCQFVDEVEDLARERVCKLFGAEHANVQPHSGAQANLAAYFSKAKNSNQVPVDYTPVKFVKKPNGAKPGMVIYTTNKTIYANLGEFEL